MNKEDAVAETHAANPANAHSMHTRTCGELRFENVGEEVTLTGWVSRRRDHGGLIFCDLRDREGITQLTFDPEHSDGDAFKIAETMRPEWPIKIHGVVRSRGEDAVNPKLATGEIEVLVDHAQVLNRSKTPPFQIEDGIETSEDTRLRYRYLDLRRPEMAARACACAPTSRSPSAPPCMTARSPRWRRRRSSSPRPRARATSWCPAVYSPATSTPCRSPRSF